MRALTYQQPGRLQQPAATISEPPAEDDPDLNSTPVLPDQHPLAQLAELKPDDLTEQEWIAVAHRQSTGKHDPNVTTRY
ncbi:hypothetical protein [Pseudomonas sp. NA-150]|uniref:hypothetical protein n=1 Tax=Pseudomonas sp. NA-150 TaxID=3367525 RepID=UPI0037CB3E7F